CDAEFKSRIEELEKSRTDTVFENAKLKTEKKLQDQEVSSGRQDTSEELMFSHPPSTNNDVSQLLAEDSNPE
ncbi:22882_t:CDS:2, partial [Racocetra persica]